MELSLFIYIHYLNVLFCEVSFHGFCRNIILGSSIFMFLCRSALCVWHINVCVHMRMHKTYIQRYREHSYRLGHKYVYIVCKYIHILSHLHIYTTLGVDFWFFFNSVLWLKFLNYNTAQFTIFFYDYHFFFLSRQCFTTPQ